MEREMAVCESDPYHFITNHIWTFDEVDQREPWKRYPSGPEWAYLENVVDTIMTPGDKYWLKSQRMLITISFCAAFVWWLMYAEGFNGLMTSKPGAVDGGVKGGWNSLFGKMRLMYDRVPDYQKEYCFGKVIKTSDVFNYMGAINEKRGNMIIGQSPTENAGVGEGFSIAFVDEAASIYYMPIIHTNLTQSCRENKNYVSFPRGKGNKFADIHFTKGHYGFKKVEIHYSQNPRYTEEWRAKQETKLTAFEIAQRLDMSFEESTEGKVWKNFSMKWVMPTEYLPHFDVFTIWDFGYMDATSIGFCQFDRVNGVLRIFDWVERNYADYEEISSELDDKASEYLEQSGQKDLKTFKDVIQGYGDPAAKQKEQSSGISLQQRYSSKGWHITAAVAHETLEVLNTIDKWFKDGKIQIDPKCEPIIEAGQFWEWPKDKLGNPKMGTTQPRHDVYSHAGKALEYGFLMIAGLGTGEVSVDEWVDSQNDVLGARKKAVF